MKPGENGAVHTNLSRSAIMRRVKSTDTTPEMKVRRAVHEAGFRYRLHDKRLPGAPDLVLPRHRLVVFVHGCFWHWHGCKRSRMPATNRDYWETKIGRNVARDAANQAALRALGWDVHVIWECQLAAGVDALLARLRSDRDESTPPDLADQAATAPGPAPDSWTTAKPRRQSGRDRD